MSDPAPNPIEALRAMLDAGAAIVDGVLADELMARWIEAFVVMPVADRPVVVDVVEREVKARVVSRAVETTIAQTWHANPNARLYVRMHGQEPRREDLVREEMLLGTLRALRVMPMIAAVPDIHADWLDATREAMEQVDGDTRAFVALMLRETLQLIESPSGESPTDRK
jgi:hypothetical protein